MSPSPVSRRAIWRSLVTIPLVLSALLIASPAGAVTVAPGVLGGFEQEGNQAVGDFGGTLDWENVDPVVITDDTIDSGFMASMELEPSQWECNDGGMEPGKDDILRAYVNFRQAGGDLFLDLAWIRRLVEGDGSAHVAFEFNQAAQPEEPTDFTQMGGTPCPLNRVDGDIVVFYDFPGGVTDLPDIRLFKWDSSIIDQPADEGAWVDMNLSADDAKGAVFTDGTIDDLVVGGTIDDRNFGEVTINLSNALRDGGVLPCLSFGTANVRSRSSGESINSTLQDRLPGTPVNVVTCGSIKIVKVDDGGNPLPGATFEVFADDGDGVFEPAVDTLVGSCTTDDATDGESSCAVGNLPPGDYFVRETDAPDGFTFDPDNVVGPISIEGIEQVVIDEFVNIRIPEQPRYGDERLDEDFDHPHTRLYDYDAGDNGGVHNPHDDNGSSNQGDPGNPVAATSDPGGQATSTQPAGNPLDVLGDSVAQPASSPALETAGIGAASGGELPRTGAGIREETLLALILMAAGMLARAAGRRRSFESA